MMPYESYGKLTPHGQQFLAEWVIENTNPESRLGKKYARYMLSVVSIEDLRGFCYLAAVKALLRWDESRSAFNTWYLTSLRNEMMIVKRLYRTIPDVEEKEQVSFTEEVELKIDVNEAIRRLSPRLQQVVYFRYREELTFEAIGQKMGCKHQSVQYLHESIARQLRGGLSV